MILTMKRDLIRCPKRLPILTWPRRFLARLMKKPLGNLTKPTVLFSGVTLGVIMLAAGCSKRPVLEPYNWNPRVHYALTELLTDYGNKSKAYDPQCRPYAVFDFDNTTIIDDIAQTLLVYQIENLSFSIAPEDMFEVLTRGVSDQDRDFGNGWTPRILAEDLSKDYAVLYPLREDPAAMRGTDEYKDFRAKLWFLSSNIDMTDPDSPFGCIWITTLLDGMTDQEVRELTRASVDCWMEQGSMWRETWTTPDGQIEVNVPKGIGLTQEMKSLYHALQRYGFDVYICSASLESVVEAMACDPVYGLGIDEDHVFGIRLAPTPDGRLKAIGDSTYAQTYREGKVQCIKDLIAKDHGGRGPALVAGDSNGDFAMLTSFPDLKVGLIVNCLRTGAIGGMTAASIGNVPDLSLKERHNPLYVVQGRDPELLQFIPSWDSIPVETYLSED